MNLLQDILKGKPRAVAKGISLVENNLDSAQDLMKGLFRYTGKSLIVGITGAPGSGKSTLVDQLITRMSENGRKIGIIAVDPSSPFSGGAILGDRIRMMRHSENPDVFIRSMATRGHLGGLAKATGEAISILEASGKDIILIETVGVGQDEVEIVKMADIILVMLIPGAGDDIQAFKAGIMEIADIFVLNKADSPEMDRAERQLRAMLDLGLKNRSMPEIVKTIATRGEGVAELYDKILDFSKEGVEDKRVPRKKKLIEWMLRDIMHEKIDKAVALTIDPAEFSAFVEKIYNRRTDPYTVADNALARLIGKQVEKKLNHVAVAVHSLEESLKRWASVFPYRVSEIEEIKERGIRLAYLELPDGIKLELIEPIEENSPVGKFLRRRGEGIHHFCLEVDNIRETIRELKMKDVRFVDEEPARGAGGSLIAFIEPNCLNGVLVELKEET